MSKPWRNDDIWLWDGSGSWVGRCSANTKEQDERLVVNVLNDVQRFQVTFFIHEGYKECLVGSSVLKCYENIAFLFKFSFKFLDCLPASGHTTTETRVRKLRRCEHSIDNGTA